VRLEDFDFDLPQELIAQEPPERRDASRLMVVDAGEGTVEHRLFIDFPDRLRADDLLVLNDTRVRPARLHGRRGAPGTGGRVEALLVERLEVHPGRQIWTALVKGSRGDGDRLHFGAGLTGRVAGRRDGMFLLELEPGPGAQSSLEESLSRAGVMPLPPYIRRKAGDPRDEMDRSRYQTVFARDEGAIAAPTASLHFTDGILQRIRDVGARIETLTLHVGIGTFQPVRTQRVEDHRLAGERYVLPDSLAQAVAATRSRGGRVVAAGTTVARTLESRATPDGGVAAGSGVCDLFILPGHRFRVVDALLTNFHLPRSTLLMLVCAFAGRDVILNAYREAVRERYRFFSYGDAMFLMPPRSARA
jgi:S-adenosylmethionine:tRNA ribosyltransferase-isomerase